MRLLSALSALCGLSPMKEKRNSESIGYWVLAVVVLIGVWAYLIYFAYKWVW